LTRLLQKIVNVRDSEIGVMLTSCAYFFFLFAGYAIIRPLRDDMGVAGGVRNLPWLFTGTLIAMLVVHPIYAAIVARLPRHRFIPLAYRFFAANLLLFFLLLKVMPDDSHVWIGRVFYVWTSVYNLFVVSVFWSFMADIYRSEQARRLYGFIAVGGTAGGLIGASTTALLAEPLGPVNLLLISVVLLEIAVYCVRRLGRDVGPAAGLENEADRPIGGGAVDGMRAVLRSPYLLGICGYMLLYTITATFLYFQQAEIIVEVFGDDRAARTALFAKIDVAVNALTIITQMFLTGRLIRWLGVAVALAALPAICILGFLKLGFGPTLVALVVFQVLRRSSNYAVARPAREMLYTVVSRDEKYKAKHFIDTFVYRGGDQIGAWSYAFMGWIGLGMSAISFVAIPLAAVWLVVGLALGREQKSRSAQNAS